MIEANLPPPPSGDGSPKPPPNHQEGIVLSSQWKLVLSSAAAILFAWATWFSLPSSNSSETPSRPQAGVLKPRELPIVDSNTQQKLPGTPNTSIQSNPSELISLSPTKNMALLFSSAKDWRAFAVTAQSRPEEGGYFYAMHATNICSVGIASMPSLPREAIETSVRKMGTVSTDLIDMVQRLHDKCASFAPGEASEMYNAVKALASDQRDPVVVATRGIANALARGDAAGTRDQLRELLSLDDPLAPYKDHLLARVMSQRSGASRPGDMWFDGKNYSIDEPAAYSTLGVALELAACGGIGPCELEEQMVLSCLGGQVCVREPKAFLRERHVGQGMSESAFAEALSLATRIREVIATHQADRLFR